MRTNDFMQQGDHTPARLALVEAALQAATGCARMLPKRIGRAEYLYGLRTGRRPGWNRAASVTQ
jgi:hypothetical protein